MNFKKWLINEVLDDVATKDTSSINFEITKPPYAAGMEAFTHSFENNGINYHINFLPLTIKKSEIKQLNKDKINIYDVALVGPELYSQTGTSGMKAFEIYEVLLLAMRKMIENPQYTHQLPVEGFTFQPDTHKMGKIYDRFFQKFFPDFKKLSNGLYIRNDLIETPTV